MYEIMSLEYAQQTANVCNSFAALEKSKVHCKIYEHENH